MCKLFIVCVCLCVCASVKLIDLTAEGAWKYFSIQFYNSIHRTVQYVWKLRKKNDRRYLNLCMTVTKVYVFLKKIDTILIWIHFQIKTIHFHVSVGVCVCVSPTVAAVAKKNKNLWMSTQQLILMDMFMCNHINSKSIIESSGMCVCVCVTLACTFVCIVFLCDLVLVFSVLNRSRTKSSPKIANHAFMFYCCCCYCYCNYTPLLLLLIFSLHSFYYYYCSTSWFVAHESHTHAHALDVEMSTNTICSFDSLYSFCIASLSAENILRTA